MSRGQRSDSEVAVPIKDAPDVVQARKQARELASRLGFSAD